MSETFEVDRARSESSGTVGRSRTSAHGYGLVFDASRRPQPDALTNSEAFLGSTSSCGVTMIESHAEAVKIPLRETRVSIEGFRRPGVARYVAVKMAFDLFGVTEEEGAALIAFYKGNCPLYGTLAVAAEVTITHVCHA